MTAIVDTSVLVRYLTQSPPQQALQAARLIESDVKILVPTMVLGESAFALGHYYGLAREAIVDLLVDLLSRVNIDTLDVERGRAIEGLRMCRSSGRVSFGDALIWAAARSRPARPVCTFDRRFPRAGLEVRFLDAGSGI
jgi:predicted nucleic-acid-binding protein